VLLLTPRLPGAGVVAAVPAFGVAWYTLRRWLENFAYRAEMNYLLFGLVLAFTLLLTLAVTGLHAFRTAQLNPADTLKHE
jgi:putative ABC transport system permease protein